MAEFAAGAGHEINNPLAVIAGRSQLLLKSETDPERRRELAQIDVQVRRAYEMIADMRLFARPPQPEFESLELLALVDGVLAELAALGNQRAIVLQRTGEQERLSCDADPVQLAVALHALCRNAVEAIGRDGRIEIGLDGNDQRVRIRISDTGPGVSPEHRAHLFDPFYSSRQAGRGMGLGLSKCWRIVAAHGGRIDVENQSGGGALFTIDLPRTQATDAT